VDLLTSEIDKKGVIQQKLTQLQQVILDGKNEVIFLQEKLQEIQQQNEVLKQENRILKERLQALQVAGILPTSELHQDPVAIRQYIGSLIREIDKSLKNWED